MRHRHLAGKQPNIQPCFEEGDRHQSVRVRANIAGPFWDPTQALSKRMLLSLCVSSEEKHTEHAANRSRLVVRRFGLPSTWCQQNNLGGSMIQFLSCPSFGPNVAWKITAAPHPSNATIFSALDQGWPTHVGKSNQKGNRRSTKTHPDTAAKAQDRFRGARFVLRSCHRAKASWARDIAASCGSSKLLTRKADATGPCETRVGRRENGGFLKTIHKKAKNDSYLENTP